MDIKPEFSEEDFHKLVVPLQKGDEEKIQFETIHRRKDGTQYPVEVHLQLMGGNIPLFVAIILDITDRRKAELATQLNYHTQKIISDLLQI